MRHLPALALTALLAACAAPQGGGGQSCGPHPATLTNASSQPVEQVYLGNGTPSGWGTDLLQGRELPPGANMSVTLPGPGPHALRIVWTNGHAAELPGIAGCSTTRLTVLDTALRAE
ncbi:MAG: hypothetical protein IRY87_28680 [Acetobacteraceae bacterium]|nr:hypothetical protein [Acetobacteraceae bacterium]